MSLRVSPARFVICAEGDAAAGASPFSRPACGCGVVSPFRVCKYDKLTLRGFCRNGWLDSPESCRIGGMELVEILRGCVRNRAGILPRCMRNFLQALRRRGQILAGKWLLNFYPDGYFPWTPRRLLGRLSLTIHAALCGSMAAKGKPCLTFSRTRRCLTARAICNRSRI